MSKRIRVLLLSFILLGVWHALSPASVTVGDQSIRLHESRAYVFAMNAMGNIKRYDKCPITGLSFFWAEHSGLAYGRGGIVEFSNYALDSLQDMDPAFAYVVAQIAFDKMQAERLWEADHRLENPLRRHGSKRLLHQPPRSPAPMNIMQT